MRSHVVSTTVENIINSGSNCGIQILVEYKDVQQPGEKNGRQIIDWRASLATDEQREHFDKLKDFSEELFSEYQKILNERKYFDSIDHTVLKQFLCRIIKDARCLELLFGVIDSYKIDFEDDAAGRKKGLPIGNLTSQFFANFYLSADCLQKSLTIFNFFFD